MRSWLLVVLGIVLSVLIVSGIIFSQRPGGSSGPASAVTASSPFSTPGDIGLGSASTPPGFSPISSPPASTSLAASNTAPDLTVDPASGLSKATVVMTTSDGIVKFKFYTQDAPNTVNRMVELIGKGFYNGLTFHRIVPGFVVQGGDPTASGAGGSGQKLKAEFNNRHHMEGTVAMARAADPDSADSQFYISLGQHPHLDRNYTVFGQVIEGMDVVKKIKVGDKMMTVVIQ